MECSAGFDGLSPTFSHGGEQLFQGGGSQQITPLSQSDIFSGSPISAFPCADLCDLCVKTGGHVLPTLYFKRRGRRGSRKGT